MEYIFAKIFSCTKLIQYLSGQRKCSELLYQDFSKV